MTLSVLSVASELYPLIKTGGLADVAGALPGALVPEGITTQSLLPGYPAVLRQLASAEAVLDLGTMFGGPARLLAAEAAGLSLFVLDAPHLFGREGGPYAGPGGDWADNPQRFAALAQAAARLGRGALPGYRPEVVHAHDWQAGLVPAYLHYGEGPRPGTLMTVHNLAFQGQCPAALLAELGLPPEAYSIDGVEYYGAIGFLKAGLRLADRVTTVSPTYAAEIRTEAGGMGLAGLLRDRGPDLFGILNGIDTAVWDPARDSALAKPFSTRRLAAREANRTALRREFGLDDDPTAPVLGVVSRLSWQKGMDAVLEALPALLGLGLRLVALGTGEAAIEAGFARAAAANPGRIGLHLGYDEAMAHRIQGGCDALLVPSRFEPCGLTQLCALRYGALPVVARVGGLADTVIDANAMAQAAGVATGLQFANATRDSLEATLNRLALLWGDRAGWQRIQRNAMACDVSWSRPAAQYAALYRAIARR
ncbi:glycogen synthase GlgA [Teichococcus vastitatis]|uniref:Glycogen synthase n=1 Tax=Teichococcus vastitatis TaxID=2307076 RepID=A0ABS9W080_9PROT|nr:glycogen synthase GlgA [Pseudoroseomonas vastitatis]MCI0752305.1 glycogen synthase GlgA [Pseudoroseomonas vastitatis]